MSEKQSVIEVCVETLEEAIIAQHRGANQIELCADLANDGLTPSLELTKVIQAKLHISIKVMIRPRAGNFVFSSLELEEMKSQIQAFQKMGIQYFVTGMATSTNQLDVKTLAGICEAFPTANFTLHKVIDQVQNPSVAFPALLQIPNLKSILTSGGAATAKEGSDQIKEMVRFFQAQITIIAAGKITDQNLEEIKAITGAAAFHGRKIVGELKEF